MELCGGVDENTDEAVIAEVWVAAAVGGAAAIGGAVISSNGAKSAANAQQQGINASNSTQLAEFNASAGLQTPGRNLGYGADSLLAELFGLPNPNSASTTAMYGANDSLNSLGGNQYGNGAGSTAPALVQDASGNFVPTGTSGTGATGTGSSPFNIGGGASPPGTPATSSQPLGNQTTNTGSNGAPTTTNASGQFSNFFNSPGYQFALGQGQQAIQRGAAAGGNLYSTNTLNQLDQNAQGYASTQYNNYVQQLMGLAGIGGSAVAGTQGAATTAGNNISANQLSSGNANASGILGSAGAFGGALTNSGGLLGNYALLSGLNSTPSQIPLTQNGGQGGGIGNIVGDVPLN